MKQNNLSSLINYYEDLATYKNKNIKVLLKYEQFSHKYIWIFAYFEKFQIVIINYLNSGFTSLRFFAGSQYLFPKLNPELMISIEDFLKNKDINLKYKKPLIFNINLFKNYSSYSFQYMNAQEYIMPDGVYFGINKGE